jgi:hypothetical protein
MSVLFYVLIAVILFLVAEMMLVKTKDKKGLGWWLFRGLARLIKVIAWLLPL